MHVVELLTRTRTEILDEACDALASNGRSYQELSEQQRRERVAQLYDLVVEAIRDRDLTALVRHCEHVAAERFHAGFDFSAVQTAFNVLEEATWRRVVARIKPSSLPEACGLLWTSFGAGKDVLARTYVRLASKSQATSSLDLRAQFRLPDDASG